DRRGAQRNTCDHDDHVRRSALDRLDDRVVTTPRDTHSGLSRVAAIDDTIEAPFVAETELLGLELLPGQKETLLAAYMALREMVKLVGADYPFETEPAHVFMPVPSGGDRR